MTPPISLDLLDQLTTPVLLLDASLRVSHANPAFCAWVGIGQRRWLQASLDELGAPELAACAVLACREAQTQRLGQCRWRPLPTVELMASARVSPVRQVANVHAMIEFYIERDDADPSAWPAALAATLKGLAHEVRNPLACLQGAAQLLARRTQDPEQRRYVEVIAAETARLAALVERLLEPRPAQALTAVNVHEILERVRLLAEADAAWSCRIIRDYDPSLPLLIGDADRLLQALWNLVRNALQAGATEVRLRTRSEHGVALAEQVCRQAIRIEVIDDGHGVPDALAAQVFLPLVSGRAEGSGLGLALTQEIVREHRGSLSFRSRPGHTVFTLMVPMEASVL